MKDQVSWLRTHLLIISLLLSAALLPPVATAQAIQFSGSATAVEADLVNTDPIKLGATGEVPATGGELEEEFVNAEVPGLLTASALHSSVVARGNKSSAESTVAVLTLTIGGNEISATFLRAEAEAKCNGSAATVSGSVDIAELIVNDQAIEVTGARDQKVPLLGGEITINKQEMQVQGDTGDITVTALEVDVPLVGKVSIAKVHADIRCRGNPTCPDDGDFVTGGGWIETQSKSRGTFAVAGGKRDGWGHLNYIDHGLKMKVKGTQAIGYVMTGPTSRRLDGTCEDSNGGTCYYIVDVTDNEEPGRGSDDFSIKLFNATSKPDDDAVPFYHAFAKLSGGNIQLHDQCRKK